MVPALSGSNLKKLLSNPFIAYIAALISALIGLFFIFVWSPLPFGQEGFDGYNELARCLARGESYPTMFRIWGYPFFLAFFYKLFGDQTVIPLVVQNLLNASIPIMIFRLIRNELNAPTAGLAALTAGVFSISTVYASTQSADTLSTVLFVAGVLFFSTGKRLEQLRYFALSGLSLALAFQFRPNLIFFPFFLGLIYLVSRGGARKKISRVLLLLSIYILCILPWIIRNYKVSGLFQPTPTHGALVLWFGSMQIGPYSESWVYSPRSLFITAPLPYITCDKFPLIVQTQETDQGLQDEGLTKLVFWTDKDTVRTSLTPVEKQDLRSTYLIPPHKAPAAVYYYFEKSHHSTSGDNTVRRFPENAPDDPLVCFINKDHLGDPDISGDFLDIFDLIRMLEYIHMSRELPWKERLDLDQNSEITENDVRLAASLLLDTKNNIHPVENIPEVIREIKNCKDSILVVLDDSSRIIIPHNYEGKITDISIEPGASSSRVINSSAAILLCANLPFFRVERRLVLNQRVDEKDISRTTTENKRDYPALSLSWSVNHVFYRSEPEQQNRLVALALDNIRRRPLEFLKSRLSQVYRLFVVKGSNDPFTAQQFPASGLVYTFAFFYTLSIFILMLTGVIIALKRKYPLMSTLIPIVYILLTLSLVQANARFAMAIQPFILVFVAISLEALLDRLGLLADKKLP